MVEKTLVHTHNESMLSNKKEQTNDICNKLIGHQGHCA